MILDTEKMIAEKEGGIGWMTFNQPERRNALRVLDGVVTVFCAVGGVEPQSETAE